MISPDISHASTAPITFVAALLLFVAIGREALAAELPLRWLYLMTNLQVNDDVPQAEGLLRRAAKAGRQAGRPADRPLAGRT